MRRRCFNSDNLPVNHAAGAVTRFSTAASRWIRRLPMPRTHCMHASETPGRASADWGRRLEVHARRLQLAVRVRALLLRIIKGVGLRKRGAMTVEMSQALQQNVLLSPSSLISHPTLTIADVLRFDGVSRAQALSNRLMICGSPGPGLETQGLLHSEFHAWTAPPSAMDEQSDIWSLTLWLRKTVFL